MHYILSGLALVLAGGWAAGADAQDMSRAEKEAFLKQARIVSVKEVGQGATKPLKVELERDGRRMKAIFKSIDLYMNATSRFGGETIDEVSDSYKHEIAAYALDKLLDLNMLPVIVEREVNGKKGSLREWVGAVMPRFGYANDLPDMAEERDRIQNVWLFDYLIANVDRRTHNLMLGPDWSPILIDHSMAFSLFQRPVRPLYRFPKEVIERLQELDEEAIRLALKEYLRKAQINALLMRRVKVLDMVDRQLADFDSGAVFFSLVDIR